MEQEEIKKELTMPPLPEETTSDTLSEDSQEEAVKKSEPREEAQQHINIRTLRKEKERLELENAKILSRLKEYESPKETGNTEEDLNIQLSDDDLFEGRHYKKLQKQLQRQQDELKKYQTQAQHASVEWRLKSQYADFDSVVSAENIKKLRDTEPEIAETLASTSDIYSKAVSAYKMIKKLGIHVEDTYERDRELVKQNSLKPKPLASVAPQQGDSPLTKANAFANELTPELKKQLWKEMEDASKGY